MRNRMTVGNSATTVRVPVEEALEIAGAVLRAVGAPPQNATTQANWLVEADRRGHGSHGIQRLPLLVRRVQEGFIAPDAEPRLEWRSEALLAVDGQRGFGPVVALAALEEASKRVKRTGVVL